METTQRSQQEETYLVWPMKIRKILMIRLYLTRNVYFLAVACQYLIDIIDEEYVCTLHMRRVSH